MFEDRIDVIPGIMSKKMSEAEPTSKKETKKKDLKRLKKKRKKGKRRKRARWILLSILAAIVVLFIAAYVKIHPEYEKIRDNMYDVLCNMDESTFRRAGNTVIYDKDDTVIGRIGNEKYEYVKITDISDYIQKGYIAKEDKRFASHHGVDFRATARAAFKLIKNKGAITQGGSTITQQVVKNNLLSQEKSYSRKILEIFIALELEKEYTKPQIMEYYCNSNYYGNGCYGVEGASQYYFGKSASKLSLAEAAILVATSNSPNNYNPVADYELSMEKKNQVLDAMLECGYITQEVCDQARQERPEIVKKSENVSNENYMISYALHCAALEIMKLDGFEFEYVFADSKSSDDYQTKYNEAYQNAVEKARTGGYEIHTSFDTSIQSELQASVDSKLAEFSDKTEDGIYKLQGAAMCIDNQSHMVVAVVGGREEQGSFNRGYQAKRQPGSSIKPLLDYGPALNEGVITPSTEYTDEKITIDGYTPKNSNNKYIGQVTVREALARSINTIAVQLYQATGKSKCMSYLEDMEFSSLVYADSTAMSLSVGGFTQGVTVEDMTKGYAMIANGGKYSENTCIRSLSSYDEGVVYECNSVKDKEVFTEDAAFMMTDMMQGTFKEDYGTAHDWDTDTQVYAGKTGTTNDNKDAWFCGFSSYYTTAVWMGYDMPESMDGVYGGTYPAEIWSDFMNKIHQGLEKKDFTAPETVKLKDLSSGQSIAVSYKDNVYRSRPSGWDYISGVLLQKEKDNEKKRQDAALVQKAEDAVSEFEAFQINSEEDAVSLDEKYNEALTVIDAVNSEDDKEQLLKRAAYKYELLSSEVKESWNNAAKVITSNNQKQKDSENSLAAQKSLEKAKQEEIDSNVDLVNWYIDQLNARSLYSSYVEQLIKEAQSALGQCNGYDKYDSLNSSLQKAINRVKSLPKESSSSIDGDVGINGSVNGNSSSSGNESGGQNQNGSDSSVSVGN